MGKLGTAQQKFDTILDLVAESYGVTAGELTSPFKYRPLPAARQLITYALSEYGLKNGEISILTGHSPGRVNYDLKAANKLLAEIPYFATMAKAIIRVLNEGQ